jgi:hypothetical protein
MNALQTEEAAAEPHHTRLPLGLWTLVQRPGITVPAAQYWRSLHANDEHYCAQDLYGVGTLIHSVGTEA